MAEPTSISKWLEELEEIQKKPTPGWNFVNHEKRQLKKWINLSKEISYREGLLNAVKGDLENIKEITKKLEVAVTDVFVEKAQAKLTERGRLLFLLGGICTGLVLLSFVATIYYFLSIPETDVTSPYMFVLSILKKIAVSSIIVVGGYFLISLARAFFHEGLALFQKRHSLRFGRLYVYLNQGDLKFEDLEKAFQWNSEYKTAFQDIKIEKFSKSFYQKIVETIPDIIRATGDLKKGNDPKL